MTSVLGQHADNCEEIFVNLARRPIFGTIVHIFGQKASLTGLWVKSKVNRCASTQCRVLKLADGAGG